MPVRGIRGATSVESNTSDEIFAKTSELLAAIVEKNNIALEDIASVIFSVTDDIDSVYPAAAARRDGWNFTPLFCCREIPVQGGIDGLIRVLMHVNSESPQSEMRHVFLHRAKALRPDIADS